MAFLESGHIHREATKPTSFLTDNTSANPFIETKAIPPTLWNASHFVLQFNLKTAHLKGSVNTAGDILSRPELKKREEIRLKNQHGIYRQHQLR